MGCKRRVTFAQAPGLMYVNGNRARADRLERSRELNPSTAGRLLTMDDGYEHFISFLCA
jgi:hypothetical protein